MHSKLVVFTATLADAKTVYKVGAAPPTDANAKIDKLIVLYDDLHVFYRTLAEPNKGLHVTIAKPTVNLVTSLGSKDILDEVLEEMDSVEKIQEISMLDGKQWKLNHPIPGDTQTTIVRMSYVDNMAYVVALPAADSEAGQRGLFFHFTLMPLTIMMTRAESNLDDWIKIMRECADEASTNDSDEEEEEEEETEEEEEIAAAPSLIPNLSGLTMPQAAQQAPPPPMPATSPNGTASTIED